MSVGSATYSYISVQRGHDGYTYDTPTSDRTEDAMNALALQLSSHFRPDAGHSRVNAPGPTGTTDLGDLQSLHHLMAQFFNYQFTHETDLSVTMLVLRSIHVDFSISQRMVLKCH